MLRSALQSDVFIIPTTGRNINWSQSFLQEPTARHSISERLAHLLSSVQAPQNEGAPKKVWRMVNLTPAPQVNYSTQSSLPNSVNLIFVSSTTKRETAEIITAWRINTEKWAGAAGTSIWLLHPALDSYPQVAYTHHSAKFVSICSRIPRLPPSTKLRYPQSHYFYM